MAFDIRTVSEAYITPEEKVLDYESFRKQECADLDWDDELEKMEEAQVKNYKAVLEKLMQ